mgnify:CR=1 FL=1
MKDNEALIAELQRLKDVGDKAPEIIQKGARKNLTGFRARGHQIRMKGSQIRVVGPQAPIVAREVSKRAGKGAQAALREELR